MGAAALPRAIGILRVSRQNRNEDSRESPEVQRRLITRFAGPQGQGWDLIEILDENAETQQARPCFLSRSSDDRVRVKAIVSVRAEVVPDRAGVHEHSRGKAQPA